ncbi:endogenous retrovirus group K member 113 Pol protein-like [Elysia marginata]|uniref:Endogenous retrovirus group K member 113 Pol protein-like n=1 Tax=Elysia marginata TaxID=1093978 RepID=A0AAV4EMC8_9GAST|nr:endogenous retrovirus group K member 113 Pol protein-like [Elysia marginata]
MNVNLAITPKPAYQKETIQQPEIPESRWEKMTCDLIEMQGRQYLTNVDHYSNFIEADFLTTTTTEIVKNKLKGHFARFGVQKFIVSDCRPLFTSRKFRNVCKWWNFKHVSSSPGYPASNWGSE